MDMEDLLVDSFEKLGYEVVKVYSSSQGITKVDVKRGNSETTFYAMSYTVTDEVQDVVVDTVGDTTVGPVAEDVKDTSTGLANGSLGGGLFNGITPQDGMKLTTLTITLPLDSSTTYRAVRQTNNALITCADGFDFIIRHQFFFCFQSFINTHGNIRRLFIQGHHNRYCHRVYPAGLRRRRAHHP